MKLTPSIFRPFFLRLSQKAQYDVMTALRAPDGWIGFDRGDPKREIVGRVRALALRPCSGENPLYLATTARATTKDVKALAAAVRRHWRSEAWSHARGHLLAALGATKGHPVWGGHASELARALREGRA